MALQGALICFCSLAVLSSSAAQDDTLPPKCDLQKTLLNHLKEAEECGEDLPSEWSTEATAKVLLTMKNLTETLHKHQLKGCQGAEPQKCPAAEVPKNGGLACVTVANTSYCKPLCSHGYDFAFLRRSRLYEKCGEQTGYKWETQYIGGNTLAVCNEAPFQISGANTAYFPKDQGCLTTKSNSQLQRDVISVFTAELKSHNVQGEPQSSCLVCG
ncbi:uncharacterized protein LOC121954908 [Plectropomus leopardus]|uniref:uncharacterized protein LOC121954908 n=1 Tax=Plectropomus leopardus TaxID=160734 RepID=UPI001C4B5C44|nr:uncharacterized protein LOC121954908 [Plectropomus leopardus]